MTKPLRTIPLVDIRHVGTVALVQEYEADARAMIRAGRRAFGPLLELLSYAALPIGDILAKNWLVRTHNPYLRDIEEIARMLKMQGVMALNLSYEWGCTTALQAGDDGCMMFRTLDWPFPEMGRHMIVTHEEGPAGDFYNVTWPGLVSVFTAMAPSRFAAAINQAPMRGHTGYYAIDWLINHLRWGKETGMPPGHLLRHVMEHAESYEKALEMLIHTPICMPAIFVLSGITEEEGCIIERQERKAYIRPLQRKPISTANHWVTTPTASRWLPREPDSYGRKGLMDSELEEMLDDDFLWLKHPVLNPYTKLACTMNALTGSLSLIGFEGVEAVTEMLSI